MAKSYPYPVSLENLQEWCFPQKGHLYSEPFQYGDYVCVTNGWVALRINTHHQCENSNATAKKRIEKLRWDFFDSEYDDHDWGSLDDRSSLIWKYGETKLWGFSDQNKPYAKTLRLVSIGGVVIVPHPVLQLISKLPRAEVFTSGRFNDPLFFRFNGGDGIAAPLQDKKTDTQRVKYGIFNKNRDLF